MDRAPGRTALVGCLLCCVGVEAAANAGPWTETGITWNNAPRVDTPALSSQGATSAGARVAFSLGKAIRGSGAWSFALVNDSTDEVVYGSRESPKPPELVLAALPEGADLPPTASPDSFETDEDQVLVVGAPGVLGNDGDEDGDPLQATIATLPSHGSLQLDANGAFVYTPSADFAGEDAFSYLVDDGRGASDHGIVTLTVHPVKDAPRATSDLILLERGNVLDVPEPGVLGNDDDAEGDALTADLLTPPTRGTLTLRPDGGFLYVPAPDFDGSDVFFYAADDGQARTTARVLIRWPRPRMPLYTFSPMDESTAHLDGPSPQSGPPGKGDRATGDDATAVAWRFDVTGLEAAVQRAALCFPAGTRLVTGSIDPDQDEGAIPLHWHVSNASGTLRVQPELTEGDEVKLDVSAVVRGEGVHGFQLDVGPDLPAGWPRLVVVASPDSTQDGSELRPGGDGTEPQFRGTSFLGKIQPHPARGSLRIEYGLARVAPVEMRLYNARGQCVRTLVSGPQDAGRRFVAWNGRDADGREVPAGIYFLRARVGSLQETRRILYFR